MKEIIVVTIALGNDGAERVLSELSAEWYRQGHKVVIVQTHAERYGTTYAMPTGIEQINIKVSSKNKIIRSLQEARELIRILKLRPSATAVSFLSASSFILAIASWFIPNKIVFSERNNPRECPVGWHQQKLRNFAFNFADKIVFQTEDAKKYFSKYVQKKGVIIPNPINGNLPERYIGVQEKCIVTAGRLHPQKNLPLLINAFKLLVKDYPEYKLVIYGQGVLKEKLEELINNLELSEKVILAGFESDLINKIKKASIYVSSSDYEGISNSILEAMGMGIPVVATDCPVGGSRMLISNNENGILVPVGDVMKLYQAMKKIISDDKLAKKLSDNAYKVREEFPLARIAKKWLEYL